MYEKAHDLYCLGNLIKQLIGHNPKLVSEKIKNLIKPLQRMDEHQMTHQTTFYTQFKK